MLCCVFARASRLTTLWTRSCLISSRLLHTSMSAWIASKKCAGCPQRERRAKANNRFPQRDNEILYMFGSFFLTIFESRIQIRTMLILLIWCLNYVQLLLTKPCRITTKSCPKVGSRPKARQISQNVPIWSCPKPFRAVGGEWRAVGRVQGADKRS